MSKVREAFKKSGGDISARRPEETATWLVAGLLTMSLFLVLGFLSLIAYHGFRAFWPQPIVTLIAEGEAPIVGEFQGSSGGSELFRVGPAGRTNSPPFRWVEPPKAEESRITREISLTCLIERKDAGWLFGIPIPKTAVSDRVRVAVPQDEPFRSLPIANTVSGQQLANYKQVSEAVTENPGLEAIFAGLDSAVNLRTIPSVTGEEWLHVFSDQEGQDTGAAVLVVRESAERLLYVELAIQEVSAVERIVETNRLGLGRQCLEYLERWSMFLFSSAESGELGGALASLVGTAVLTLAMLAFVIPLGLAAALYLHEYTEGGWGVSLIRASVTNLAGVPSVIFGIFGLTFFCYTLGAFIDGGASNAQLATWPSGLWVGCMILLVIVNAAGFTSFLLMNVGASRQRPIAKIALFSWLLSSVLLVILFLRSPFFEGFFAGDLPNPTFGKGGVIWGALTLSLLALPTMIVTCEEALAQVPNRLRSGSLACGATKWQTIYNVVLPHARHGIYTGGVLCAARSMATVAPLMLVGVLPNVQDWPVDAQFPFVHGSRGFMHLGHQVYVLGFESQDAQAAQPLAFACSLLLVLAIALLNLCANWMRLRMRSNP